MTTADETFEIFCAVPPGLEYLLLAESAEAGLPKAVATAGGITFDGTWQDVMRANLMLRGATRVLARVESFWVAHLSQLDKRSRKIDWARFLPADLPVKVEVTCRKSKIYHAGAAKQRIETAITETLGAPISEQAKLKLMVRIEEDLCTISVDTSGSPLHMRGHKEAVGKAPMRESLAALFLHACGYDGREPVLDPMCGSGTFPIEAAEMAMGLAPGRSRRFAFEDLASFDAGAWAAMKEGVEVRRPDQRFFGSDRNAGGIENSNANAARSGVAEHCAFSVGAISELQRPEGPPGLVIVNPPYGGRIGNKKLLYGLYGTMGTVLKERFKGWRVGIVTTEAGLARSTTLKFANTSAPIPHGGLKIRLHQTKPLL
jgi:putative N6-adenine-specific DNA methylase